MQTLKTGDRVVLVEDHRDDVTFGRKGWTGTLCEDFSPGFERSLYCGGYRIKFDNGQCWYVNESAVAPLDPGHTDADLAMALELARLMGADERHSFFGVAPGTQAIADWLRTEVTRALLSRRT